MFVTPKRRHRLMVAAALAAATVVVLSFLAWGSLGLLLAAIVLQIVVVAVVVPGIISLGRATDRRYRELKSHLDALSSEVVGPSSEVLGQGPSSPTGVSPDARQAGRQGARSGISLREHLGALERELLRVDELGRETRGEIIQRTRALRDEVKRRHGITSRAVRADLARHFAQTEALLGLYYEIKPVRAFPATRSWVASPDLLRYLYLTVQRERPELILECGSGLSTVILAYGLRDSAHGGKVVALEHLETFARQTTELLEEHELTSFAEVRFAPLSDVALGDETLRWYDPSALPGEPIDLVVVDGPPGDTSPQARYPALPLIREQLTPAAVVLLDDYEREEEREVVERWQEVVGPFDVAALPHEKGTAEIRFGEEQQPSTIEGGSLP